MSAGVFFLRNPVRRDCLYLDAARLGAVGTGLGSIMISARWLHLAVGARSSLSAVRLRRLPWLVLGALLLASCLPADRPSVTASQAVVDYDLLLDPRAAPVNWQDDVRPVVEGRCVVCHACYDAPCQLKLSSHEGLLRGANPQKVYDGARIRAAAPTRMFVDATTTAEWRAKGFHPVMNEATGAEARLADSVLYRMLRLKQLNPQPRAGMLPEEVPVELDRKQVCTTQADFDKFARQNPLWGMPYGMPNLSDAEYATLVRWLAQGAPGPQPPAPSAGAQPQIDAWEAFLNGESLRERLMSRYLYEHLFLGHLHLEGTPEREFYRLVRSRTPPGEPIDEVPTVRPFDDPGAATFWYRLRLDHQSVVAKDHVLYEWSERRMARYRQLFLEPAYEVRELPSYAPEVAANPLVAFAGLPMESRYRFMLDDARFFIEGFIKGPVCRGQVALNVIEDRFWVVFFSPDRPLAAEREKAIEQMSTFLQLPASDAESLNVFKIWTRYWEGQKVYMTAKQARFEQIRAMPLEKAVSFVWDGGGSNPNAGLTIFRHTDSAYVANGLLGDYPETAWVMDYPLFERIHYLLVAGFDVYGNVGHQLSTRIVMDFLRMEGEDHFLAFLPSSHRRAIRDSWYQGIRKRRAKQFKEPTEWLSVDAVTGYRTDDPQRELYEALRRRLGPLAGEDRLNRCGPQNCAAPDATQGQVEQALRRMAAVQGRQLIPLPDVAFLRVRNAAGAGRDLAYSLVVDKSYSNLTSMLENEDTRSPDGDRLTILPGFYASYPNFFFDVDAADIVAFADRFTAIRNRDDYERFVALYGLRRTNPKFWEASDWFQAEYGRLEPLQAGIFDLNRYRNR